ncbi:MAG: hypothetical protein K2Q18_10330 [Bdellovibrionales bacterium]|nr:hypothetical protein [Bdellovibrionales bacterium]
MKEKIIKHKNIVLFLLLVLALVGTYVFEERGNQVKKAAEIERNTLFNADSLGEIKAIVGVKLNFEKRGDDYYDKITNLKLSQARLNEFFQILSGLKIKSQLNQEEVNKVGLNFYIPDPSMRLTFHFEKGEMTFVLGKKLEYDQSFYLQVIRGNSSQVVIAHDDSPDPGVYQNDEEYKKSDAKFKRLQIIFLLTNKYFHDTRVFKDMNYVDDKINFKSASIATFRNKKYSISFETSTTNPPAPKGINYFEDNWLSFHRFLTKLEGKSAYYPADPKLLGEPLSQLEITDRENRKYTLEVYKKYGEENGYFLKTSLNTIIYELKQPDAEYFFVNVQDFWEKRLPPKEKEFNMKVTFYDGKTEIVQIQDKELFKVFPTTTNLTEANIRALEFKRLLEFFKGEGSHITDLDLKPSDLLKKNVLRVQFDKRNLSVILEENEAIIVDSDLKIMIHHYIGAKLPFSIKHDDYFVAAKK